VSPVERTVAELAARLAVLEGIVRAQADTLEELQDDVADLQGGVYNEEIIESLRQTQEVLSGLRR
jgi:uncharacterized coiled-coil protein SlyX